MRDDDGYRVALYVAGSEPEARGIDEHLRAQGVDSQLAPFKDTAYPGVVDQERPWGAVLVPRENLEQAQQMLTDWQGGTPEDLDEAWQRSSATESVEPAPPLSPTGLVVIAFIVLALALMIAVSAGSHESPFRWSPIGDQ